eukprot:2413003-Amphidinium_carterae.1
MIGLLVTARYPTETVHPIGTHWVAFCELLSFGLDKPAVYRARCSTSRELILSSIILELSSSSEQTRGVWYLQSCRVQGSADDSFAFLMFSSPEALLALRLPPNAPWRKKK